MGKFTVFVDKGVNQNLARKFRKFFRDAAKVTPVHHNVGVCFVNLMTLSLNDAAVRKICKPHMRDQKAVFGWFVSPQVKYKVLDVIKTTRIYHRVKKCDCLIVLPCKKLPICNQAQHSQRLIMHASHEIAHYIQFRNKKKLTEKGVEKIQDRFLGKLLKHLKKKRVRS
jgi:hypothetical protein